MAQIEISYTCGCGYSTEHEVAARAHVDAGTCVYKEGSGAPVQPGHKMEIHGRVLPEEGKGGGA